MRLSRLQTAERLYPFFEKIDDGILSLIAALPEPRKQRRRVSINGPVTVRKESPGPSNAKVKYPPAEGHVERSLERQADRILRADRRRAVWRSIQENKPREKPSR